MPDDPDIECFLRRSGAYMNINSLPRNWEQIFVDSTAALRHEARKESFKRGFAKAALGQLSAHEYEKATGWDFDTHEDFREHLEMYWRLFYGEDKPEEVLSANPDVSQP